MKLENLLFRAANIGVLAGLAGLAFNALALALFAGAAGLWILTIATADYGRRTPYHTALTPALRGRSALPLAA